MQICAECKYGVVGKYSHIYKGRPIGCNKPDTQRTKGRLGIEVFGKNCFEPKENHADNQRED